MSRSYLVLAVTGASMMTAAFATGLAASSGRRGGSGDWGEVHLATSLGTVIAVLVIHSIVYVYFLTTVRWAREVSRANNLPDWLVGQARRNEGRAARFIAGGAASVAVAASLGAAVDARAGSYAPWHLAAASFALGFNAVALFIEYAGVVSHHRLLAEVKLQAGLGRSASRGGPPLASRTPA